MNKKILVTGATGNIAGFVIPQLLEAGATVHAYVRDANRASHLAEMGALLFEGDFTANDVEAVTGKKARNFKKFLVEVLAPSMN